MYAVFGVLALALAAVGVHGVVAYSVGRRTREIGVRIAVGAGAVDVLRLILGESLRHVGLGLAIGAAASMWLTRALEARLYGVSATDPVTFVAASSALFLAALFACYAPARRALRVDPVTALRHE